jgi:hypothetical protein
MARVISFFPRGALVGAGTIFSEIFDVTELSVIVAQLRSVSSSTTTAITGSLEETSDPTLEGGGWAQLGSNINITPGSVNLNRGTFTNPLRFIRAKIVMPATTTAVIYLEGVGREAS